MSDKREGPCAGCVQADHMCHYCKRDPRRADCYDDGTRKNEQAENMRKREEFSETQPKYVTFLIKIYKDLAHLVGCEIVGRVAIKDKDTGRIWR